MRRANDPQRREKIIQATLEAVKLYGIHAVTHRKIATLAGVPLGWHCCKVSDEAAFCLIQRPYISKTLLTRRISPRGSP